MKTLYLRSDTEGLQQYDILNKDAAILQRNTLSKEEVEIFKKITDKDLYHFTHYENGAYRINC